MFLKKSFMIENIGLLLKITTFSAANFAIEFCETVYL